MTWGILALAVFVAVGMGEWSKRTAMAEKVVSPEFVERAVAIASKVEDRKSGMGGSSFSISQLPSADTKVKVNAHK